MTTSNEPEADDRPATWDCWSEVERDLWMEIIASWKASEAAREALWNALPDHSHEMWLLVDRLQTTSEDEWSPRVDLLVACLKRYRPDLADLFAFAAGEGRMFPAGSPHEFPYGHLSPGKKPPRIEP
jgi:hypothetical protein